MSDTPRTDEAVASWPYQAPGFAEDFARTLERELDTERKGVNNALRMIEGLNAELAQLKFAHNKLPPVVALNIRCLRKMGEDCFPEVVNGQKHFARVVMESVADDLEEASK